MVPTSLKTNLDIGQPPVQIPVTFQHHQRGKYDGRLEITFRHSATQRTFIVVRRLRAAVGNVSDQELLRPTAPYTKNKRVKWRDNGAVVEGERPPSLDDIPWIRRLPKARVPKGLSALLASGATREVINQIKSTYLPPKFVTPEAHAIRFKYLLWIEEARMA